MSVDKRVAFSKESYGVSEGNCTRTNMISVIRIYLLCLPQAAQALNVILFFPFYANVQTNVTYGMYYYLTTEFDHAKHDSHLAAYGGVVLQRFEFIKVCMGMQRLCLKSQLVLYFVNKIYLPCCCVVFFVVCQLLEPI